MRQGAMQTGLAVIFGLLLALAVGRVRFAWSAAVP